ncbi:MAG: methyltransferase domain-containing protein [Myxococcota bacterium]|nr:methyltransferase domain-containing protein [Myxococcota bacterium]
MSLHPLPGDPAHNEIREHWNRFSSRYNRIPGQHTFKLLDRFFEDSGSQPLGGKRVLDLACGAGRGSRLLACHGASVDAVDLSEAMLDEARSENSLPEIKYHHASGERLPFEEECFDEAFCCLALMLVPNPTLILGELRRVLKRGGRFHVVVWGRKTHTTLMTLFEDVALELGLDWPEPPRSNWHLGRPQRLEEIAEDTGLALQSHRYVPHPFPLGDRATVARSFGLDELDSNPRLDFIPAGERARFAEALLDEACRRMDRDGGVLILDALLGVYR